MSKVHLIKDESLGGIEREYKEVDRDAIVGDYVVITAPEDTKDMYEIGDIMKAEDVNNLGIYNSGVSAPGNDAGLICHTEYKTLEPTDIVQINVERFRLVDRKEVVGDKVLIVNAEDTFDKYNNGDVIEVQRTATGGIENDVLSYESGNAEGYVCDSEYVVLEPVKTNPSRTLTVDISANTEFIDLIANLARRVNSLEQQLKDTQGNVERQAEELEYYRGDFLACGSGIEELDAKIEMITDDIVMLDERTQSPKEVNDFIALVAEKVAHKLLAGARR